MRHPYWAEPLKGVGDCLAGVVVLGRVGVPYGCSGVMDAGAVRHARTDGQQGAAVLGLELYTLRAGCTLGAPCCFALFKGQRAGTNMPACCYCCCCYCCSWV